MQLFYQITGKLLICLVEFCFILFWNIYCLLEIYIIKYISISSRALRSAVCYLNLVTF